MMWLKRRIRDTDLYVVSEEEDLGEAVTNIVVQQALQGQ
jgi:hypothetical protein